MYYVHVTANTELNVNCKKFNLKCDKENYLWLLPVYTGYEQGDDWDSYCNEGEGVLSYTAEAYDKSYYFYMIYMHGTEKGGAMTCM